MVEGKEEEKDGWKEEDGRKEAIREGRQGGMKNIREKN